MGSEIFKDLFIFEMANSHQGSVEHGIDIIHAMSKIARKHNIKAAVKLQFRNLDNFIHPDYKGRQDVKHIPRFESTRLSYEQFNQLVDAIHEEGLIAMSTPFDEDGVEWCMDMGVDIIKIASCSSLDWPLLETAARAGKPLIISTGGKTLSDIDKLYAQFAEAFEEKYVSQGYDNDRSIEETLEIGWELLSILPKSELKRIKDEFIEKYYKN